MKNALGEKTELARADDDYLVAHFDHDLTAKHDEALIRLLVCMEAVIGPALLGIVVPDLKALGRNAHVVGRNPAS